MFSHVMVGADDLPRMRAFYDALLTPLGLVGRPNDPGEPPGHWWRRPGAHLPGFGVQQPFDGRPASQGNGCMVAFLAAEPAQVNAAYEAGLRHGGTDEGGPVARPQYGEGYHGAYLRDPEGNKVHVVHRGDREQR